MEPPLLWSPLRVCILPLQHYSYHGAPRLVHRFFLFHQSLHAVCTPPWCSPAALDNSQCLLTFFLLQPCLDCGGNPSGAQLGTKTGHAWPFSLNLPSHSSLPSSPASSGQSSQSQSGLLPLSSPWACRVEWFDLLGNSMGFSPRPLSNLASSSQPALVIPLNLPENSAHAPPPVHSPPVQSPREDTSVHREKPQDQPHSCSDCTTCAKFQDGLAILQDLVFEVRKEVDDLRFHLEILDKKGTQILQLLSSLHGSRHSTEQAPSAPAASTAVLVPALQMSAMDNAATSSASALWAPTLDNVACITSVA